MYEYKCVIIKVIDGDTVEVDIDLGFGVWIREQRIRLLGIDTPESRSSDKKEKVFGLVAKEFVEKMLPIGSEQVIITQMDAEEKFGRVLGDFVFNETTLCKLMIADNYAVCYDGTVSKDEISAQHLINRTILIEKGIVKLENNDGV